MRTVAEALGVSQAAVSLALRNSCEISEQRRTEIQAAAERLGYVPNIAAISLSNIKHGLGEKTVHSGLAWVNFLPGAGHAPRYDAHWRGASTAATSLGFSLQEFNCAQTLPPDRLKTILVTRGVKGIILPADAGRNLCEKFDWKSFATVRIGHSTGYPPVDVVGRSQSRDTLLALAKMREKGYRRIGHLTSQSICASEMYDSVYLKGQLQAGAAVLPVLALDGNGQSGQDTEEIRRWIRKNRPDAIISTLPSTRSLLTDAGFQVPGDIAVASLCDTCGDADAGVAGNAEEIGRAAVRTLVRLVQRNETGIPAYPQEILLQGRWIEGQSLPGK